MISVINLVIIAIVSAFGGFIQRVTGFGFGIFVMLFFPYVFSVHTSAAAVSTLVSCFMSTYNAFCYRKDVPYKKIFPLLAGALIMIPISVRFSVLITGDMFKKILGIVLVILSIYFMFFNNKIKIKPTFTNGLVAGGTGGILTGLFSTGGPPIVLYLMNALADNVMYFASTQFYFGVTGIYSTLVRVFNGIVTTEVLICALVGFIGCTIGNTVGKRVFDKLDGQRLRMVIYIGMIISGVIMVV